jgi:hypothetical protein
MHKLVRAGLAGREHTWTSGKQRISNRMVSAVWLQYYCKGPKYVAHKGRRIRPEWFIEVTVVAGRVVSINRKYH